jgi:hypothetical protein
MKFFFDELGLWDAWNLEDFKIIGNKNFSLE